MAVDITPKQYVILFSDGSLYVDTLLVLALMREAGIEFEELGVL